MLMSLLCTQPFSIDWSSLQDVGRTRPWKTKKVRVTARTALRAVDFKEMLKGELEFPSQCLGARTPEGSNEILLKSGWIAVG